MRSNDEKVYKCILDLPISNKAYLIQTYNLETHLKIYACLSTLYNDVYIKDNIYNNTETIFDLKIYNTDTDKEYIIEFDGFKIRCLNIYDVFKSIISMHSVVDKTKILFHGSSVARNNRAVVLLGESGAGKTTLTCYMVNRGYDFISDDFVVADVKNNTVIPFQTALHLRKPSINLLHNYGVEGNYHYVSELDRYLYYPLTSNPKDTYMKSIFLCRYSHSTRIKECTDQDAIIMLLKSLINCRSLNMETIKNVVALTKEVPVYLVEYNTMDDVIFFDEKI